MTMTMLIGASLAPVAQTIPGMVVRAETVKTVPEKTKVNVYKLQAKDYADYLKWDGIVNDNGVKLSQEEIAKLGTDVTMLDGVTFRVYKVKDKNLTNDEIKAYRTKEKADNATDKLEYVSEKTTSSGGLATFELDSKSDERYLFVESNAPELVSSAIAVPFVLALPVSNSKGTGFETEINVYPKNISGEKPSVGKDVNSLGNNAIGAEIGKDLTFFLKGTIPTNIQDYTQYQFNDTLDSQLSFVSTAEQIKVKYGTKELTYSADYTVEISGQTLTVKLTEAGINKIAKAVPLANRNKINATTIADVKQNTDESPFIQVDFQAEINENAILGKDILNKTSITYTNSGNQLGNPKTDPNNPSVPSHPSKETPPSDETKVYTGGKRFVKTDAGNANQKLSGAEFDLFSDSEAQTAIKWTTELLKANKKGIDAGQFVDPKENEAIVLKSNTDGTFDILGLSYGLEGKTAVEGTTDYYLKETKAPENYVLLQKTIAFTVNQTSYNTTPVTVTNHKMTPPPVKPSHPFGWIPQTGETQAIFLMIVGFIFILGAFILLGYRRLKHDKGQYDTKKENE